MEGRGSARRRSISFEKESIASLITEAHVKPVDEASFMRYYKAAMKAASMEGPAPSVRDRIMRSPEDSHESVLDVMFGDDSLSRMAIAMRNILSEEGQIDRFPAVSARILALVQAIGSGSLRRWAVSGPDDAGHRYYPGAVVCAAAVSPLNDDLTFQMDEFERLLELRLGGTSGGKFTAYV